MNELASDDTSHGPLAAARQVSRRDVLWAAVLALTATVLSACGHSPNLSPAPAGSSSPTGSHPVSATPPPIAASTPQVTASTPPAQGGGDEASLRRRIASLLIVGFRGQRLAQTNWVMRAVAKKGLGGVILFDRDQLTGNRRNIVDPDQVTALIRSLQAAAPRPIVVSIDQEGGRVTRLNPADGFGTSRSEAEIGAADDASLARSWSQGIAADLARIGVTLNFAPVVDLDVNPTNPAIGALGRSFSGDPAVVVEMATQEIRAHHRRGIRTTLKHFPGFGSATGNTDFGVVDVTGTWHRSELDPFRDLIAAGVTDAVMVAHLLNRNLDPDRPASLSRAVVTDLLRSQLGWHGPVVSDDMQAAAITRRYGQGRAVTFALAAGVDVLLFANQQIYDPAVVDDVVDTVFDAVWSGDLTESWIEEAATRADRLRTPPA